jgi:hypothetical protein
MRRYVASQYSGVIEMEWLTSLISWLDTNKQWVFSGIGVVIAVAIIKFFFRSSGLIQSQKSGKDSKSFMAGRDMKVTDKDD